MSSDDAAGTTWIPPVHEPGDRPPRTPFVKWAARNPLRVLAAVAGLTVFIALEAVNQTVTFGTPSTAELRIRAARDICWVAFVQARGPGEYRDCGSRTIALTRSRDAFFTDFTATVRRRKPVRKNEFRPIEATLVVGDEVVDRTSTTTGAPVFLSE